MVNQDRVNFFNQQTKNTMADKGSKGHVKSHIPVSKTLETRKLYFYFRIPSEVVGHCGALLCVLKAV